MVRTSFLYRFLVLIVCWLGLASFRPDAAGAAADVSQDRVARGILDGAGIHAGVVVHLGCADGKLTAALHNAGHCLVQGLDANAEDIRRARAHIRDLGIYGPVSIDRFDGGRLPYADNLVNLLVAEELGGVTTTEAMRVLAPGGVLYSNSNGSWTKQVKPRPEEIDEWTHYLHDSSGNAVAHDSVVGPPGRLQWTDEPRYMRSHEHIPGIYALVSAGGRIFYIADQAPVASVLHPTQWNLVARDAFNGTLLWQKSIPQWFPHIVNWGHTPPQLERRLVAVGRQVYVTLGLHAPVSALDAATGEILKQYKNTEGAEEILCHKGILLLATRTVTEERTAELARWKELVATKDSPVYERDSAEPLVQRLRRAEGSGEIALFALDADSGEILWKRSGPDIANLKPLTLCAVGTRVFYQNNNEVVGLDLKTGRELWSRQQAPLRLAFEGNVFCAGGQMIAALSAETGEPLWEAKPLLTSIHDLFVAGGSLWVGGFKPCEGKRGPSWGPYFATQRDLATGKVLKHIEPENPGHHHRCYLNKATDRYLLGGRRGTEFIDLVSGEVLWHSWARGVCKYGVMPCNGLLYAPPHACGCYIAAKLIGFNALAPREQRPADENLPTTEADRLQRGPAYSPSPTNATASTADAPDGSDWPTYRHDASRSGATVSPVPASLQCRWQVDLGSSISGPTINNGAAVVAGVNDHRVAAFDAETGRPAWQFTAGGRVDSPPTLHEGRAVFGCRDGNVYSVALSDGQLAWRLRAARRDRRIAAGGQLESAWPVPGSVLIENGVAYCTAGRSSYLDGGIDLVRFDPRAGEILSTTVLDSPDPQTGRQPPQFGPSAMPGMREDILTSDNGQVYLRDTAFDFRGKIQEAKPHLFALTGFLDDCWTHRSYWIFGKECSIATGCSGRDKKLVYGRLLVFNDSTVYGYGRDGVHWSNQLQDGAYRLFSVRRDDGSVAWEQPLPIQARAMVLADKILFVAGPPAEPGPGLWSHKENRSGSLLAVSAADGSLLAEYPLDAPPVFDGLAAAAGRLYLSLEGGRLVCLDGRK